MEESIQPSKRTKGKENSRVRLQGDVTIPRFNPLGKQVRGVYNYNPKRCPMCSMTSRKRAKWKIGQTLELYNHKLYNFTNKYKLKEIYNHNP